MSDQNQKTAPAFIQYTDDFLSRRKEALGTEREISQRALEVVVGRMAAEGEIEATFSEEHNRYQVSGDEVTDEVLAEAASRHREYLDSLPVSLKEARKAVGEFVRQMRGDDRPNSNWSGILRLNSWMDLSAAKAQLEKLEAELKAAELDFSNEEKDYRELRDAAEAAMERTQSHVFDQHVQSVERQIAALRAEDEAKADEAEAELKDRLATTDSRDREKAVRALGSRLHRAGFSDPKRSSPEKRVKRFKGPNKRGR